jgi:farnesyl-diphosphate farnesyltransferase
MAPESNELLKGLLQETSRSFYLTLRVLPSKIRTQIGLAYLLARTTDTIADTSVVPVENRLNALETVEKAIHSPTPVTLDVRAFSQTQGSNAERQLLEKLEQSLSLLRSLSDSDRAAIQQVLRTIISGQTLDLRRFLAASAENIVALQTDADLDDYTYRVAGCVGEFWTEICRAHLFANAAINDSFLMHNGVRFGKGLQLVNVLRDLPMDLRQGRCYLPAERLATAGLNPRDLLQPASISRLRTLYDSYLGHAREHLTAGWAYTNALPRGCARVRLACAWPILIGLETIDALSRGNVLNPAERIKITRSQVKRIIRRSLLLYPFPRAWKRLASLPQTAER